MKAVLTRQKTAVTSAALTGVLAAASWVVAWRQMQGMDMGVSTPLGSFRYFIVLWVVMMAAMMLPGAVPAVARHAQADQAVRAVPLFVVSYLAVWTLVGLAVYVLYRPHGTLAAGVIVILAGGYELTALKRRCRQRCRDTAGSGVEFGRYCVGSSGGLMLILVALSVMSIAWMVIVAAVVVAQKLIPARAVLDVPLTVGIIALGVLIVAAPATVPGLMPTM